MISYVNVHAVLDGRRSRARAAPNDSEASQVIMPHDYEFMIIGLVLKLVYWIGVYKLSLLFCAAGILDSSGSSKSIMLKDLNSCF